MKKSLSFLLLILCVFMPFSGNILATGQENNGYITQFYKEYEENNITAEEEPIILESLQSYWEEDLKVAEILVETTGDSSLSDLVLSTGVEDKINAIQIIENNFKEVDATEQEMFYQYIERHAKGTEDEETLNFLDSLDASHKENQIDFRAAAAYDGAGAGKWAYNNYNKYSKDYPKFTGSFGTNCTNFVSQAMLNGGGLSKQGDWTISRKNTKYHVINSAAELNYSWKLTDPSPWISVKEFSKFWRPKSTVRGASKAQYLTQNQNYRGQKVGDIVILSKGAAGVVTVPTHAMIITQVTANDYNLAGNSVERQAHPLRTAIDAYSYVEFYRPR